MLYEVLHNEISQDFKKNTYDRTKILITRRYGTSDYSLRWEDKALWGATFMGKKFVRYNRIRMLDKLPDGMNPIKDEILRNQSFEDRNGEIIAKDIGRFIFEIEGKKWVIDVIFPQCTNRDWSDELYREYVQGVNGMRPSWRYDIFEASMIEFVTGIINQIPVEDRNFENIIRSIMGKFSSENSEDALIEGKWGGTYSDGKNPTDWEYTAEIFRTRKRTGAPVKYGQCWVFAECMTAVMRFLGIPARTIYARNSHINISLNFSIDLYGYSNSDKFDKKDEVYKKITDFESFISNDDKDDEKSLSDEVFIRRDSIWNFHYWTEIYVPRDGIFEWECLDTSPMIVSEEHPMRGKKILGPCVVANIKNGSENRYDYDYLASAINSPFRLWTKTMVLINDEPAFVSFVHSIIFPFHPEKSIISRKNSAILHDKDIILQTKIDRAVNGESVIDITGNYKMSFEDIERNIYKNHPAVFIVVDRRVYINYTSSDEEIYNVQQLGINSRGIPIAAWKRDCKLCDVMPIKITPSIKFLSFLIHRNGKFWPQLLEI